MANIGPIRRKSARMLRPGTRVIMLSKRCIIATVNKDPNDPKTIVITMDDGSVFRRSAGSKIELA